MAELKPVFQNIADAIREKNGLADTYTPEQMPTAIKAIETGGSAPKYTVEWCQIKYYNTDNLKRTHDLSNYITNLDDIIFLIMPGGGVDTNPDILVYANPPSFYGNSGDGYTYLKARGVAIGDAWAKYGFFNSAHISDYNDRKPTYISVDNGILSLSNRMYRQKGQILMAYKQYK